MYFTYSYNLIRDAELYIEPEYETITIYENVTIYETLSFIQYMKTIFDPFLIQLD